MCFCLVLFPKSQSSAFSCPRGRKKGDGTTPDIFLVWWSIDSTVSGRSTYGYCKEDMIFSTVWGLDLVSCDSIANASSMLCMVCWSCVCDGDYYPTSRMKCPHHLVTVRSVTYCADLGLSTYMFPLSGPIPFPLSPFSHLTSLHPSTRSTTPTAEAWTSTIISANTRYNEVQNSESWVR